LKDANIYTPPLVFSLHDPLEPLRIFAFLLKMLIQTVRIPVALRRCKYIAEKFKSLSRVKQCYTDRQPIEARRQTDGSCYNLNIYVRLKVLVCLPDGEIFFDMFSHFDRIPACDGRIEWTERYGRHLATA